MFGELSRGDKSARPRQSPRLSPALWQRVRFDSARRGPAMSCESPICPHLLGALGVPSRCGTGDAAQSGAVLRYERAC